MANQIILKRSSTTGKVPTTSQLALGEIAINTHDGRIFIKKDDGTPSVVEIGGVTTVNGLGGSVVLSTTEVAEGTAQYFTQARARASLSAGTGISYNSSTGAISTSQNLSTTGAPTFAGLTLTGSVALTGDIIPSADNVYSLGSPTKMFKDVYVGPGSLYINGSKVLEDVSDTITFTADVDQNIRIKTQGTGILQLGTSLTTIAVDGTLQLSAGKRITSSDGVKVQFGDDIEMNNNKVIGVGTPTANTDAATKGYVDTSIAAISTSSITQGNSSVQVVDSGTGTVTVTVDGNTALTVDSTGVIVAGNFTVSGTTTTVNSNTVAIADNILTLNSDATGTPTQNAGIEVERGDDANVQVRWNEGSDKWTFSNDGASYYPLAVSTDDLGEGSTNQYFTTTRARASLSATTASGVSYNSASGVISIGGIPNTSLANNSITVNTMNVALGGSIDLTTDYVQEGSGNQYFTTARARGVVSATGSLAYNSTTGVISYTTPTTIASLSNHSTTDLAEGTNLYFTNARAVSANTSAIATAKSEAISAAATDATSKVAAEASARDAAIAAAVALKDNTDEITEGTTNLYFTNARARAALSASGDLSYNSTTGVISFTQNKAWSALTGTPTTVSGYGITNAYTKTEVDSAISTAVAGKDNTDEITEGSTNLYFTNARAVSANTSAIATAKSEAISSAATDATSKVAAEATARDTAIATAIATEVTNRNTAITAGVVTSAGKLTTARTISGTSFDGSANITLTTAGITEATNLYYTDARVATRVNSGLTHFHATFQSVTSAQATTNATATVAFTFADLATAKDYNVFLNRMLLRPTEFSVSGSTLTVAIGMLATDDEIEVSGLKFA